MINPKALIWTEKFRPTKVNDIVGDFKNKISQYLKDPMAIPNFLLYSRTPGTGKTTTMKAIVNELGCDYIIINSSDERGVDSVREKVKQFALTQSSKKDLKRCVMLDESDGMTKDAQNALRNVMETYASNVFFILTANNINKVIEPLRSRCVEIPFSYPKKEEIAEYLLKICEQEKLDYTLDGIQKIIDMNYPSIRNCVLCLQDLYTEQKDVTVENIKPVNQLFVEIYEMLNQKKWQEIKEVILSSIIDARELNTFIWERALEENNIKRIQLCCRNERDIALGADSKIIVVSSLTELMM